ncbi:glycosyltransferase family 9 protein [Paucidesulfovibrio longus]|uniref:glycosyltransferase family 9 protein n=1 Tax=Paucidesulfovibrio longus TaxID=889 RepID=UPI0003B6A4B8|nr:glycosyltransferase family 9 protein [Paucidesulfovibrio longus]
MSKVLIVQLARFGDLVQTGRLVSSLQDLGHEVHFCLDRSLASLAELLFPQAVVHPVAAHRADSDPMRVLLENRAAFDALTALDFESVYNLNYSGLNFQLATLFDADSVRGYKVRNGQQLMDPWPAMAMRWSRDRRIGLNLVDFWAGYAAKMRAPGLINPEAAPKGGGIGIVMAGRESRRSLPIPVLANVAQAAWRSAGEGRVFLLGSATESPAARQFLKLAPAPLRSVATDLTGKTNWGSLVEIVAGLDRVLTPDTGIMHLAAHLGVPVTAFFLSSAWCFETGPYGLGHTVYQAVQPCLPCLETKPCPHDVRCVQAFSDPGFLRFLSTGKVSHAVPGIIGLKSGFDSLGVVYDCFGGEDADAARRSAFRCFLADHLGLAKPAAATNMGAEFADRLYLDRNWIVSPDEKRSPDISSDCIDKQQHDLSR